MKRDKTTIKVLTIMKGPQCYPKKINDISILGLPEETHEKVSEIIKEHKMLWEVWMESAEDFQELKKNLKNRGIKKTPMHSAPINRSKNAVNPKSVKSKANTMLRKKKN